MKKKKNLGKMLLSLFKEQKKILPVKRIKTLVQHIDIMPTVLDAAGVTAPRKIGDRKLLPIQGKSVLELFSGKSQTAYVGADELGYELFGQKAYFC